MSFALSLLLVMTPVLTFTTPKAEGLTGVSAEVANNGNVTTSAKVITVSNAQEGQAPLSATVTYDSNFVKGQKTRFTYNVMGNTNPLMFRLYSFCIKKDGVWNDVIDISKSPFNRYSTTNYFEECLYSAGTYRLDFNAMEYEDNGDGTKKLSNITRFQIEFSIAESEGFETIDATVSRVAKQCQEACAAAGNTSEYAHALWFNDWIIDNTAYDNSYTYMDAEGVFGRGLATCEGYHEAYTLLLNKVGIETRRVDSFGDAHVWTGVKLDGKWYNVDTTWNDSSYASYNGIDMRRLYFALPTSLMRTVHKGWDGAYAISYNSRAPFDADSYEDNFFIQSREISKFTKPYVEDASGTYSVKAHLAAQETSFSLPLPTESISWPPNFKEIIYALVAYQLGKEDWGNPNVKLLAEYNDDALNFSVSYSNTDPTPDPPVSKQDIASATVSSIPAQTYTGRAITPQPVVTLGTKKLVAGTDYTITYANNVNVGTATITIKGMGNYTGTKTARFTIVKAQDPTPTPGPKPDPTPTPDPDPTPTPKPDPTPTPTPDPTPTPKPDPTPTPDPTPEPTPTPDPDPATPEIATTVMHRLYNPNSGEHFYTASEVERDHLVGVGWNYEGAGWTAPTQSNTPVYRLYNANAGDHHYTTSVVERDHLVSVGWNDEGIGWYSDDSQRVPLFRQYNPNAIAGSHNYTTSKEETDMLIGIGWHDEGIGWYGV